MQHVRDFYDLYYSPNNAILVVAGDVNPEEVLALAETYYGAIPAEPELPERLRPAEPRQLAERRMIYEDERVSQPYVTRAYLAPERDSGAQEEAAALLYLAEILGGSSFTSVLGTKLTFDTQTALFTGAGYDGGSLDDATFTLTVAPSEGVTLQEAEDAMDAAVAAFMADGIDPAQLELGRKTSAALLPDGAYGKIMDQMLGQVLKPILALDTGMSASQLAQKTGIDSEAAEALTEEQRNAVQALLDPNRQQRNEGMMAVIKPMIVEAGKLLEPPIREGIARAYARKFSAEQLNAVNAFFTTPAGAATSACSASICKKRWKAAPNGA